ncbi:MAG TPA: SDR family NAD(P)-dependent oxidoreductase [Burkholderiaceae bacterium]|nr:SDR family NAD(P)-dependent oxidoreductase [Burkholderiaceae bacterium]
MDLFSLEGRTALVTGGSRGIGRMIAAGFLDAGARVYINARKAGPCVDAAAALSARGPCLALPMDISTVDGARALAAEYARHEPHLDILVNNAGAVWAAPLEAFPEQGWDKVMNLDVKAPFFVTQALLPALKAAAAATGRRAKVINVASIDGWSVSPVESYSYAASKAGLIHLTRRLALRLAGEGVVVSAIAPGAFASDMNTVARDRPESLLPAIPAGRIGVDDDMAGAAIYLASRAGDYAVGTTLVVDGGVVLTRGC